MLRRHCCFVLLMLTSITAHATTPAEAAQKLDRFIDEIPGLGPGYAAVVVTADEVLLNKVSGVRRASSQAPLTVDTPIYIASQTKSYVGLLAAILDERGVLKLDSTLADHWPDLKLPGGADPAEYTLSDLLTHQVPLDNDFIVNIEAYVTRIEPADYPRLIQQYGSSREAGFKYDNLGYNIYSAILETRTGKTWQQWLDEVVFEPLKLSRTSARTSDFSLQELAYSHIWQGDKGWHEVRPKTDGKMQSAGGIVTSTSDMARWLQLQLKQAGPRESGISKRSVNLTHTSQVETGMEDRRNPYELACSGYSLGWNLCDFEGHEVFIHGGGYTGNRTMMAFVPSLGIGVAAFSNSDNQTGWFTSRTVNMYLQFLTDHPNAAKMRQLRIDRYPERVEQLLAYRQDEAEQNHADERWEGWAWRPDATELAGFTGLWRSGEPYRDLTIHKDQAGLSVTWGDETARLRPASPGLFAFQQHPFSELQPLTFRPGPNEGEFMLEFDDEQFSREIR
ncbi:MAG: serine hydrolase domain-containing protein [Pseudomonadota bacterium]